MVLEHIFKNKCEKNKTGFDNIGYKIFFICWMTLYWLNVSRYIFSPPTINTSLTDLFAFNARIPVDKSFETDTFGMVSTEFLTNS